ncbi:HCP-like protein [Hesseltinella vesiculosa]|uniref:HCP-like protein n=1 Tax=Hesseltinella vesiculosa TaxID=101127 RepID=A0A1X2GNU3_9FUNG|nr:HCP-like protein [Hesseltinella vesiculosa]
MSLISVNTDPLLDHSHLKPGQNASLLSYAKTINMYHSNAKKTNDFEIQCDFAIFLVEAAKRLMDDPLDDHSQTDVSHTYLAEAAKLLRQLSTRGHGPSQYYLANMFASGLLHKSHKPEFDKAFPLFVQAAKHHHPDAAYRTAKCYEDGVGTRRDKAKAAQFYRKAATLNHPGAMYRLGLAQIKGDLGMSINIRDGHKWLKRSAEASTAEYPHALHELAQLHERGLASIIFLDHEYAVRLYQEAASLHYAPSCFRLGECYEFGRLGCTVDPHLSMHYYSLAAEQGHPQACFALTAWYLVGAQDILPPDDEQAFAWALRAADHGGLPKAVYAVGYFYEVGIGIQKNHALAMQYYAKAAQYGEKRALRRMQQEHQTLEPPTPANRRRPLSQPPSQPSLAPTPLASEATSSSSSCSSDLNSPSSHSKTSGRRLSLQPSSPAWVKKWSQKFKNGRSA